MGTVSAGGRCAKGANTIFWKSTYCQINHWKYRKILLNSAADSFDHEKPKSHQSWSCRPEKLSAGSHPNEGFQSWHWKSFINQHWDVLKLFFFTTVNTVQNVCCFISRKARVKRRRSSCWLCSESEILFRKFLYFSWTGSWQFWVFDRNSIRAGVSHPVCYIMWHHKTKPRNIIAEHWSVSSSDGKWALTI